jgi:dolichol-phosphate mannosyltransferase
MNERNLIGTQESKRGSIATASEAADLRPPAPELTVVVPTYNERANVPLMVECLEKALAGVDWEVIFVDDDSPDGTAAAAKAIGAADARVRCLRRIGRRGLAGACLEGMLTSQARFVAVMDGDLQHDESLLADMLAILRRGEADLVVATRYASGAAADGLSARRSQMSRVANRIAGLVLSIDLSDPMSGFFMLRRDAFEGLASRLSTQGFKLLMDIVSTARGSLRVSELPQVFRKRLHGTSKIDARISLEFAGLLLAKATNDLVSLRFIFFCVVGAIGLLVHFVTLAASIAALGLRFELAQSLATVVAITSNFFLNNAFTYRDQRLVGGAIWMGLVRFHVVSLIGALSNIGVGSWLFSNQQTWWVAGLGGAILGVVWNYVIASLFVWRNR